MSWIDIIPQPDVFFDFGVGMPNTESIHVKRKWPDIPIIGLEPHPKRFSKCATGYPGTLLNAAVGETDCTVTMQHIDGMLVNFPRSHQRAGSTIEMNCRSVDSLNKEYGPFHNAFIWADIEGAELLMLKGAQEMLKTGKIVGLYLEVWNIFQTEGWATKKEIEDFLRKYRFEQKKVVAMNQHCGDIIFMKN